MTMYPRLLPLLAIALSLILLTSGCGGDDGSGSSGDDDGGTTGSSAGDGETESSNSGLAGDGDADGSSAIRDGGPGGQTDPTQSGDGDSNAATGFPVGAFCVQNAQCDQSGGMAVCCASDTCSGIPCECLLQTDCAEPSLAIECAQGSDCDHIGGNKVCCRPSGGGVANQFCTKPSACNGETLP